MNAVLITGAASGIGLATAELLQSEGCKIVSLDREPMPQTFDHAVKADLSEPADLSAAVTDALEAVPEIDCLVNCAGIYPVTPLLEMSVSEWNDVLNVNLRAPFLMVQALAQHWKAQGTSGVVVNVASTAAVLARPGIAHYAASKAGLVQMTKVMAVELAPLGIRVNTIAPGLIATEKVLAHAADAGATEHKTKLTRIPAAREGTPEEVAQAIRWLLSEDASYATGSVLTLDGGFTLGIAAY